jgi:hypothetical protein
MYMGLSSFVHHQPVRQQQRSRHFGAGTILTAIFARYYFTRLEMPAFA